MIFLFLYSGFLPGLIDWTLLHKDKGLGTNACRSTWYWNSYKHFYIYTLKKRQTDRQTDTDRHRQRQRANPKQDIWAKSQACLSKRFETGARVPPSKRVCLEKVISSRVCLVTNVASRGLQGAGSLSRCATSCLRIELLPSPANGPRTATLVSVCLWTHHWTSTKVHAADSSEPQHWIKPVLAATLRNTPSNLNIEKACDANEHTIEPQHWKSLWC